MSSFIPSLHFESPDKKLSAEWAMKVVNYCYYNSDNRSLLHGKDVDKIEDYAKGDFDMRPFMRMFKSLSKKIDTTRKNPDGSMGPEWFKNVDTYGIEYAPVAMLPQILNSASAIIEKVPIEATVTAQDALAMKYREEDLIFLKNKSIIEDDLQDIADQMNLGNVDLGTTEHSFQKFSSNPMGLDLNEPDEENIFVKLLYSLTVESALEKALAEIYIIKKRKQVRSLETMDQFKFGVSCNRNYESSVTGLPDHEYIYPGRMHVPFSSLQDHSDDPWRILDCQLTPMQLMNYFGDEICDENELWMLVNGDGGYAAKNGYAKVKGKEFKNFKMGLKYIEIKTIDWIGITSKKKNKKGFRFMTTDPEQCQDRIWGQNTYGFYWLMNTKYCFGIHKLGFATRTRGQESFQNFSTSIYKSVKKSAVELSISENRKAQIADIKIQHTLIKSLPKGSVVDIRPLRNAIANLKDEESPYTLTDLLNLAYEHNQLVIDTTGFDGKNDGQMKPFYEMPGGLSVGEISGYLQIMINASNNIAKYTGINEAITGQGIDPDSLVGLEKLKLSSGVNALYYISEAMRSQEEGMFTAWIYLIQESIKAGGKTRQAIIDMVGASDERIVEGLKQVPAHDLTLKVTVGQREVERQNFERKLEMMVEKGVMTTADEYLLRGVDNPKERFAMLAVIEKRAQKKADKIRQEQFAQQQQMIKQQGQNQMAQTQAEGQQAQQLEYSKGEVKAKLLELGSQLGMHQSQIEGLIKRILQKDRNDSQLNKSIQTIKAKSDAEQQRVA